jgi:hypothetical protein
MRSYSLLFNDGPSRKLFASVLRHSADVDGRIDPVLVRIYDRQSGQTRPATEAWALQSRSVYHARAEFPLLGARLLVLQRHIDQCPKNLRLMLRDRRHPLESINLQAVIIFGILSLLFSLMQVVIGALQVAYAIKQAGQ